MTAALLAVCLYAAAILSIGLTRDWELIHEDNGALHTTFALSHLQLGLSRTRGHNLYFEPAAKTGSRYGHHPPGPGLVLAAAFALAGSDGPAVARGAAIAFQLASIALMMRLLARLLPSGAALVGGIAMATLPMGAYFGRMVNYESLCLLAVMLELTGYVRLRQGARRTGLTLLAAGVVAGGLIDWPALFFAAAIMVALIADVGASPPTRVPAGAIVVLALAAGGVVAFDLVHLWYAGGGSLAALTEVLSASPAPAWGPWSVRDFVESQIRIAQRYYTDAGLLCAVVVAAAWLFPRRWPATRLFEDTDAALVRRLLGISAGAALGYVLAAPSWARVHAYWQFYALPYVVLSMTLVGRALWHAASARGSRVAWAALAVLALDTAAGSASSLYYRHTHPSGHAVRHTAEIRAGYVAPRTVGWHSAGGAATESAPSGTHTMRNAPPQP